VLRLEGMRRIGHYAELFEDASLVGGYGSASFRYCAKWLIIPLNVSLMDEDSQFKAYFLTPGNSNTESLTPASETSASQAFDHKPAGSVLCCTW
jgi:hypothetical protein